MYVVSKERDKEDKGTPFSWTKKERKSKGPEQNEEFLLM